MSMGLSKYSWSTALLSALKIKSIYHLLYDKVTSLWYRSFTVNTLFTELCFYTIEQMYKGNVFKGTLLHRLLESNCDIIDCIEKNPAKTTLVTNGISDSILTVFTNFNIGPGSTGQHLLQLLTRSF